MTMVFATIFFTVILAGASASLLVSLAEAWAAIDGAAVGADTQLAMRRRVRVRRTVKAKVMPQPQRAAA